MWSGNEYRLMWSVNECRLMCSQLVCSRLVSCHIMSYHVISCHIVSYRVISCHIVSYIMSCHIMSNHFLGDCKNATKSVGKARILVARLGWENFRRAQLQLPQSYGFPPLGWPKCKEILRKSNDSEIQAGVGKFQARATSSSSELGFPSLGVAKM